ncbi:hypothetical protein GCM10027359_08990 [Marilutibacter aestuarii]
MDASAVAAWWGAIVATVVLLWDFYKWKSSGASISMNLVPNKRHSAPSLGTQVFVEVSNTGDRATTLTHLAFYGYKSKWHRLVRRKKYAARYVPLPFGGHLPYELKVGSQWTGSTNQDELLHKLDCPLIYAAITHSGSKTKVLKRLHVGNAGKS